MIKKSTITKKIGTTALALSLVCFSVKSVYADRIVSTIPTDYGGITTFQIGCSVSLQKPSCNTNEKTVLPEANDYGKFFLSPNETAEITIINPNSKDVEFNVDIEVKGRLYDKPPNTIVTVATIKNVSNSSLKKSFIVKNNFDKGVNAFIVVNNLTIDASPALKKKAEIKVVGKSSIKEAYTTKDIWEKSLIEATADVKKYGYSQPFGCTVSVLNEQCLPPMVYPISRGESVNVTVDFGSNPPKNARADWQVSGTYITNNQGIATTFSTVQTSYKNETKTFKNNTGSTVYIAPRIMNFTHKDGSTSKAQVTMNFVPDFKK
ncbi:MAG: hypothetical protein RI956_965 [Pseudomonadota bacterium]|jgi:hypothetical protein